MSMRLVTEKMFVFIVVVQHSLYCKLLLFAVIHTVILTFVMYHLYLNAINVPTPMSTFFQFKK